jgi:CheY-like chemotaxis protein
MSANPTVLYVEDDAPSRKVMHLIAKDMGNLNLLMFEDSSDFITRVQALEPKPDLVFLDIHMKPFNGFEMLEILRGMREFDRTPIVAMTASVMHEEIQQLRAAGFDGCLAKPLDMDTFAESFNHIMNGESIWRIIG